MDADGDGNTDQDEGGNDIYTTETKTALWDGAKWVDAEDQTAEVKTETDAVTGVKTTAPTAANIGDMLDAYTGESVPDGAYIISITGAATTGGNYSPNTFGPTGNIYFEKKPAPVYTGGPAKEEPEPDHFPYMFGRNGGKFEPDGQLTRAEAATILARLTEGFDEDGTYTPAPFSDVTEKFWGYKYICFAAEHDIINGYSDGTFRPNAPITREEFAAMIARFVKMEKAEGASKFTDVGANWATGYIVALENAKIVEGSNGKFRPKDEITRAEAAKVVNGAIGRVPLSELDLAELGYENPFPDVQAGVWYFVHVMEAGVEHVSTDFHE